MDEDEWLESEDGQRWQEKLRAASQAVNRDMMKLYESSKLLGAAMHLMRLNALDRLAEKRRTEPSAAMHVASSFLDKFKR